jgi:phosphoinositide-3-kinase regulatory subunit 4
MGTLAFVGGLNIPDDDKAASSNSKLGFIVSAGSDRRIRFWDLANPAGSMIISGLDAVANGTAASKPQYESTQPGPNLSVVTEHMPRSSAGDGAAAPGSKKGASPRPPRSTVISLQQQMLLKSHLDIIQDVAVLRQPYGMIVSVDRAGMVYVFK